jgi:hypothetical protein
MVWSEAGEGKKKKKYIVQVHVDAAIVQHEEVPDRVDALDGVFVVVIGAEEPGVLGFDEVPRRLGTPELHDKKDG